MFLLVPTLKKVGEDFYHFQKVVAGFPDWPFLG